MRAAVEKLWPEIQWIENPKLAGDHRRPLESSLLLALITLFGVAVFAGLKSCSGRKDPNWNV